MIANRSKGFLSALSPQFVQCYPLQRSCDHNTLSFWAIHNFPRFADKLLRRELLPKFRFEPPSAPHSLDENWFEGEGTADFGFRISDCGFQIRRFCRAFP